MAEATQAQIRAQELLEQLWLDGDIGEKIRKAAKAKFPDAKILDDTVAPFVAPLKAENAALKERLDKMEADRAAEREAAEKHSAQTNLESALARARQDYNLTDEGFDKMVAHMKETGNYSDPRGAAAFIVSQNPPPPPPGPLYGPGDLNFAGSSTVNEDYRLLHQNPEKYFDSEVRKMLTNPRDYVAKEMGDQYATLACGR